MKTFEVELIEQAKIKASEYSNGIIDPNCNNIDEYSKEVVKEFAEKDFFAGELFMIEVFSIMIKDGSISVIDDTSIDSHLKRIKEITEELRNVAVR